MSLTFSDDVERYKVWLKGEKSPVELEAEIIKHVDGSLRFEAQGEKAVLIVPVDCVKSVWHTSLAGPPVKPPVRGKSSQG
jgi:hypothetical protein